jgi:hypothetical protein
MCIYLYVYIDRKQRRIVESLLTTALAGMTGDLTGTYYPLGAMTKEVKLIDLYIYIYIYIYIYLSIYKGIHIYIYIYTHMHMYTSV